MLQSMRLRRNWRRKSTWINKKDLIVFGKKDQACLLKKSLYGLKQSLMQWYKWFYTFMIHNGFTKSLNYYDSCVYHGKLDEDSIYFLLYIDDILIDIKIMLAINKLKKLLGEEFDIKNLGGARKILGMEITWDKCVGDGAFTTVIYWKCASQFQHGNRQSRICLIHL